MNRRTMRWAVGMLGLPLLFVAGSTHAQERGRISLELFGGSALSLPSHLTIAQAGYPDIEVDAKWTTDTFVDTPYYMYRITYWTGRGGWSAEMLHHKIVLDNRPPEVQRFKIAFGFNIVTLARVFGDGPVQARAGAGVVVANPSSTIRYLQHQESEGWHGYFLTGPAVQAAVSGRQHVAGPVYLIGELKGSAARARVPVVDGNARTMNLAAHFLGGVGVRFF